MKDSSKYVSVVISALLICLSAGFFSFSLSCSQPGEPMQEEMSASGEAPDVDANQTDSGQEAGNTVCPHQLFNIDVALGHIKELCVNIGCRPAGTEAEGRAAEYIKGVFSSIGYEKIYEQGFPLDNGLTSRNIYVLDEGSDPDQVIIIGAHYDTRGGTGSPGANDNGSGVATVLELARIFRVNDNVPTLLFVTFGSEEILAGYDRDCHHFGSRYLADHLAELKGNVIGMISVDMVAAGSYPVANSTLLCSRTLLDLFVAFAGAQGVFPTFIQDPGWSDHESFEARGISSFWAEYREDIYYHLPQDNYDNVNPVLLNRMGSLLQGFIESIDQADCQVLDSVSNYR